MVITSPSHGEGPGFEPQRDYFVDNLQISIELDEATIHGINMETKLKSMLKLEPDETNFISFQEMILSQFRKQ